MTNARQGPQEAPPLDLPSSYDRWRRSRLGRTTDALERRLILDQTGNVAGQSVLDVGCGDGDLVLAFAQAGAQVTGVDTDFRMLKAARDRITASGIAANVAAANVHALPFASARFDVVTAVTVLCFVPEAERAMAEIARALKPGGRLVIAELGRASTWAAWRRLRAWFGHATWRAARFRGAGELRTLAARAGLVVRVIEAAIFYPPIGWIAALMAPVDRWLGRRWILGGALVVLVAEKPFDGPRETEADAR
jgi:ubiquinone/menaquinone biosynthesis C-methylase UbiE